MRSNSSCYQKYSSISPSESKAVSKNENESGCVNSYISYDLKDSVSTRQPSQSTRNPTSTSSLNLAKLQSKILELQKNIDTQRYQLDILTAETQQFVQICEQQKHELSHLNLETLRGEYEQQIAELVQEKEKITELICNLNEQYRMRELEQEAELTGMREANAALTRQIEQALSEKELLLRDIEQLDQQHGDNESVILEQEERIDELRNIERKLFIAMKEMRAIEATR